MEKVNNSLAPMQWLAITHSSDIAAARRVGQRMAQELDFDDTRTGQLAIVITEAATNILKHASDGRLLLSHASVGAAKGIEVLAIDRGPGITNLVQALRDGISSTGTAGTGLGAIKRLSDHFDAYTHPGKGTVFCMRLWQKPQPASPTQFGAVCLPLSGETASGDAWFVAESRHTITLMAVDGLGHGPEAAKAADAAMQTLSQEPGLLPARQVEACHQALRPTRGAALAVGLLDLASGQMHFAGVGNIGACIIDGQTRRQLVSHNGIVGHNMRKVQEFVVPCAPGALVIMTSDGIGTQWDLSQYPGLVVCDPAVIAAVLLRDFGRSRDDALVVVQRVPDRS